LRSAIFNAPPFARDKKPPQSINVPGIVSVTLLSAQLAIMQGGITQIVLRNALANKLYILAQMF
jgi:hypothetical protein